MKKSTSIFPDVLFLLIFLAIILPFALSATVWLWFEASTKAHPFLMAFLKFTVLSTFGEILGVRLKTGQYLPKGFGLVPRMLVWGVLGVTIASAMTIFASGTPILLQKFGVSGVVEAMHGSFTWTKLFGAFCISSAMNLIFGPIFMTFHKVTDTHIELHHGGMGVFTHPLQFGSILEHLNWKVQYDFVFKKTIPFFWIPAHTLTFMMPPTIQVLLAASYGIVLGVLLSIAANKSK